MRKVLLTEKQNILIYDPSVKDRGSSLQANEYVDLAVSYEDRFQKPITRRRLMWKIAEGKAILQAPTTLTNGKGKGINKIKVKLDDPKANAIVRLLVWPLDEPEAILEIECTFGAPKAAPPVTQGNVLRTVFPRGYSNRYKTPNGDGLNHYHILYCDNTGELIPQSTINITAKDNTGEKKSSTEVSNKYLYTNENNFYIDYGLYYIILDSGNDNNKSYHSQTDYGEPNEYVILFWPPRDSKLNDGYEYTLKALFVNGDGTPVRDTEIFWDAIYNADLVSINPRVSRTDVNGIATSTIKCTYIPGKNNEFGIMVDGNYGDLPTIGSGDTVTYYVTQGLTFSSITPPPDAGTLMFGQDIEFVLTATDASANIADSGVTWSVSGTDHLYFSRSYTPFDERGQAKSNLITNMLPQGVNQDIQVTIAGPDGVLWSGTYSVGSRVLKQITRTDDGAFPVGVDVPVTVQLFDSDGVTPQPSCRLQATPGPNIHLRPLWPVFTGEDGTYTFMVTAIEPGAAVLSVGEVLGPVPTSILLDFGVSSITINPPLESDMRYDTKVPVTAQFIGLDNKPAGQKRLKWTASDGVKFVSDVDTAVTDADGFATVEIYYETLTGYPGPGLTTVLTATADDGTTGSRALQFTGSGHLNRVVLVSPEENTQFTVNSRFTVAVKLVNGFGHPMGGYHIRWQCAYSGITEPVGDAYTREDGIATFTFARSIAGKIIVTALVLDARTPAANFHFESVAETLPDHSLLYNNIYAHLNTNGDISEDGTRYPTDESQVITIAYRCLDHNKAQSPVDITWSYSDSVLGVAPFDEHKNPITDIKNAIFHATTNSDGLCIVNFTSYEPGIFQISAYPTGSTNVMIVPVTVVFATFDNPTPPKNELPMVEVLPSSTITIPDKITSVDNSFELKKPHLVNDPNLEQAVFWIRSRDENELIHENIRITSVGNAEDGIKVPYSYIHPSGADLSRNTVNYMFSYGSNYYIPQPITPIVLGTVKYHHPDPYVTRSLPKPTLSISGSEINYNNIFNGLTVEVPYYSKWAVGDVIELNVYLNGSNAIGDAVGDTIVKPHEITSADLGTKDPIKIKFTQDELIGYAYGTFEADYSFTSGKVGTWSYALDDIILNTVYPFG